MVMVILAQAFPYLLRVSATPSQVDDLCERTEVLATVQLPNLELDHWAEDMRQTPLRNHDVTDSSLQQVGRSDLVWPLVRREHPYPDVVTRRASRILVILSPHAHADTLHLLQPENVLKRPIVVTACPQTIGVKRVVDQACYLAHVSFRSLQDFRVGGLASQGMHFLFLEAAE